MRSVQLSLCGRAPTHKKLPVNISENRAVPPALGSARSCHDGRLRYFAFAMYAQLDIRTSANCPCPLAHEMATSRHLKAVMPRRARTQNRFFSNRQPLSLSLSGGLSRPPYQAAGLALLSCDLSPRPVTVPTCQHSSSCASCCPSHATLAGANRHGCLAEDAKGPPLV